MPTFLIPNVAEDQAEDLLERFYKLYDRDSGFAPAQAQAQLSQELLALCGSLPIPDGGSITFIGKLPFGFAYPEYPTTHLFEYPDLGCAVINGFAAEQPRTQVLASSNLLIQARRPRPKFRQSLIC